MKPSDVTRTVRRDGAKLPVQVAPGVHLLEVGQGFMRSNVYFVRSGSSWVLIDTASANCHEVIQEAAASLFGPGSLPAAILLTHDHPDHAGSTRDLARKWDCPVYVHPDELRFVTADASTFFPTYREYSTQSGRWRPPPLDRWIVLPMMHAMPRQRREALWVSADFSEYARALDVTSALPGVPDWECIAVPGHTPGHAAFFRRSDRVLIAGDAVLSVDTNSLRGMVQWTRGRNEDRLSGPPWYTTWNWQVAKESVVAVAQLEPAVLAPGHGNCLSGEGVVEGLRELEDRFAGTRTTAG